jgi:hypothetical protein
MSEPASTSARARGQARHGTHGLGERRLADERDRVDRDVLATDVVPVGLGDRADRHLPDLRAAADDDHALAVDPRERLDHVEREHDWGGAQLREQGGVGQRRLDLERDPALLRSALDDLDRRDVALVPCDHAGELV